MQPSFDSHRGTSFDSLLNGHLRAPQKAALPDLDAAYSHWREKQTDEAWAELLDATTPVITSAIRSYAGAAGDPVVELRAWKLATDAIDRFDPARRVKLGTYLMSQLQPLHRIYAERHEGLKLPQQAWYDVNNLRRVEEELRAELQREPSVTELADATGLSVDRIGRLRGVLGGEYVLEEHAPREEVLSEPEFWAEAVYYSLSPVDQLIFDYRLGAHGKEKLPVKEIAQRLNLSAPAISGRITRIISKLEER